MSFLPALNWPPHADFVTIERSETNRFADNSNIIQKTLQLKRHTNHYLGERNIKTQQIAPNKTPLDPSSFRIHKIWDFQCIGPQANKDWDKIVRQCSIKSGHVQCTDVPFKTSGVHFSVIGHSSNGTHIADPGFSGIRLIFGPQIKQQLGGKMVRRWMVRTWNSCNLKRLQCHPS